ncbi:hypothetical protein ACTI_78320 [Actinoplanes sp. OR16]|uniref:DUF6197 family protein n=1 Tax=Actinoplanes sp. OR16 TaxID=946334 RepID=UPI000F6B59FD|nr:hypothetical protein [Actinoplanes sp. OR16]BBH71147.1 hypothetical protein ACTI_78320 [Actinoplanes sp. OR16]
MIEDPIETARLLPEPLAGRHHPDCCCGNCDAPCCTNCGAPMLGVYSWDELLCPGCVPTASVPQSDGEQPTFTACESCLTEDGFPSAESTCATCAMLAEVLCNAALYLERHGWIQGGYYDATTGVFTPPACIVGAIAMVCYGGPVDAPAQHFDDPGFFAFEQAVLHLDRYLLVENGSESYEFNDAKGRTADDVIRVLRDAATRPVHELIDALKAIEAKNERLAESGITTEQVIALLKSEGVIDGCPVCDGVASKLTDGRLWCATTGTDVDRHGDA